MAVKRKKPVRQEPQKQESRFWEEAGTGRKNTGMADTGAQVRKNRAKAARMNLGYAVFMLILLTVIVIALIGYISLQTNIKKAISRISTLEYQVAERKSANDENYNEIMNSIDLDEIRDYAINVLGMQYASDDQVITYSSGTEEYVHQVSEVGD
ncbi:MAG: hypothetical protein IKI23_07645 [Lachnospiraceae bacterium]|nr:hypothetical protein [Lachnospiraceae bacterium]